MKKVSTVLSLGVLSILLAGGYTAFGSESVSAEKLSMCYSAGNVEVNVTPSTKYASAITFKFANANAEQVSVNVKFTLVDSDGNKKNLTKDIVIPGNNKKEISFQNTNLGMKQFSVYDCDYTMTVEKCL